MVPFLSSNGHEIDVILTTSISDLELTHYDGEIDVVKITSISCPLDDKKGTKGGYKNVRFTVKLTLKDLTKKVRGR